MLPSTHRKVMGVTTILKFGFNWNGKETAEATSGTKNI